MGRKKRERLSRANWAEVMRCINALEASKMQEFKKLRQEQTGFRRYFYDDALDLYVWYDRQGGNIVGFQLVYDKKTVPKAITWIKDKGFRHNKVDEDSSRFASHYDQTPILVADGVFDMKRVTETFLKHYKGIDKNIAVLVYTTIRQYDPRLDDQFI